jgi:DNA replication initiation complex subunit (GINS family)
MGKTQGEEMFDKKTKPQLEAIKINLVKKLKCDGYGSTDGLHTIRSVAIEVFHDKVKKMIKDAICDLSPTELATLDTMCGEEAQKLFDKKMKEQAKAIKPKAAPKKAKKKRAKTKRVKKQKQEKPTSVAGNS